MSDFPIQCPAVYDRVLPDDLQPTHVRCTYIEGHQARHSFETLQVQDAAARDAARAAKQARLVSARTSLADPSLRRLLTEIEAGSMDDFLELILSAGHSRKLARRGVAGFGRVNGDC
jgi:hypothetical protein